MGTTRPTLPRPLTPWDGMTYNIFFDLMTLNDCSTLTSGSQMADFIIFYDSNHSSIGPMAKRRASELNATAITIDPVKKLSDEFERLKSTGVKVDRMLFYTHGDPGGVHFGTSVFSPGEVNLVLGSMDRITGRLEVTTKGKDLSKREVRFVILGVNLHSY